MGIKENLTKIKEQIGNNNVKIIAVTKYATEEGINEVCQKGIHDFGESYVQDALEKQKRLKNLENIRWHFVGRLQKNKVKYVVNNFNLIHSVDSVELANVINKTANRRGVIQEILLQVNITQEVTKTGFSPNTLEDEFAKIKDLTNIRPIGLMTMATNTSDTSMSKDCFLKLVRLREALSKRYMVNLKELSMGMSNDYKIAVECGSTMVRLGRAIFKGG